MVFGHQGEHAKDEFTVGGGGVDDPVGQRLHPTVDPAGLPSGPGIVGAVFTPGSRSTTGSSVWLPVCREPAMRSMSGQWVWIRNVSAARLAERCPPAAACGHAANSSHTRVRTK